jgi:hypothetical protein
MSNCIDIHNCTVIPYDQILQPQMLMARAAAASQCRAGYGDGEFSDCWTWFLTLDSVIEEDDGICFEWGYARSGHTWRDFKATLLALSEYLVPDIRIPFEITDEYDGHEEVIRVEADPHTAKFYEA